MRGATNIKFFRHDKALFSLFNRLYGSSPNNGKAFSHGTVAPRDLGHAQEFARRRERPHPSGKGSSLTPRCPAAFACHLPAEYHWFHERGHSILECRSARRPKRRGTALAAGLRRAAQTGRGEDGQGTARSHARRHQLGARGLLFVSSANSGLRRSSPLLSMSPLRPCGRFSSTGPDITIEPGTRRRQAAPRSVRSNRASSLSAARRAAGLG